ncbi:MAG: hypothetical protein JSV18_06320 [Candidatus Bathyarchaeota archaeon]|nr:MAG: hypothetical protein JSV18_06320 [Candidatus Bathyarchaeota archaeon]
MTLISTIIILFTAFIAAGGIYDLLDKPPSLVMLPGGVWSAIHNYWGEQTINESLVSMILTLFMFGGLYIAYRSTRVTNDPRKANTMLIIGLGLILMGLAGSHYLLNLKRNIAQ